MYRVIRRLSLVAGLVLMMFVLIFFGFFETGISNLGYFVMWILCAAAIRYGAGVKLEV